MKNVLLLLAQGFEAYEASVFTDVMGWSRCYGNKPVNVLTTSLREEIKCTWNLIVKTQREFSKVNIQDYDALAIPGGFEEAGFYEDAYDEKFLDLIRAFEKQQKLIASVCVGAMPIGKSGILKNRTGTTYDLESVRRSQLASFGVIVKDEKIVVDQNIITSTGPSTALDVAFILLEKLTDADTVNTIKKRMRFI